MAVTGLRGRQILDGSVVRGDLNTTTTGDAVIRRIIEGTGLSFSSTGVDTGTGDVTLTLATSGVGAGGTFGSSTLIPVITVDTYGRITAISTVTAASGGGSGTVTSVSVVSANGFAGTVATNTTTPAITLSTTVTGLLKGNGTAISAATPGTDYLVSNQSITLSGAVTGSGSTAITTTLANSVVGIANLSATGTPSATTFLRGDNTWATPAGGGGASNLTVTTLTGNTTLTTDVNQILLADTTTGSFTITLPTAVSNSGVAYTIKKINIGNPLTVATTSSQTIDGSTSISLNVQYESIDIVSNGTNWFIL